MSAPYKDNERKYPSEDALSTEMTARDMSQQLNENRATGEDVEADSAEPRLQAQQVKATCDQTPGMSEQEPEKEPQAITEAPAPPPQDLKVYSYPFPRPMVTVDLVIFTIREKTLQVLLIKRGGKPFKSRWALPGGFVQLSEGLDAAARRELLEETGVKDVYLEQLYTFGHPKRDPRGRVITVAYFALIAADQQTLKSATDAREASWHPMDTLPSLAFDHQDILEYALERLRNKLEYSTVGFQLLGERFTLTELQDVYQTILGRKLDKRNFRRKMSLLDILEETEDRKMNGVHRPARLYRFKARAFEKLKDKGIYFPF